MGVTRTTPCGVETTAVCQEGGCGWAQGLTWVSEVSEDLTGGPMRLALEETSPPQGPSRCGSGRSLSAAKGVCVCVDVEIVSWL